MASSSSTLEQLRHELVQRFPGSFPGIGAAGSVGGAALRKAPVLWVEVALGQGGLAWLAAWTLLRLADDPLGRPALFVDTYGTYHPGELLDLERRLVVVRPEDPAEAHVAADIALRSGSFSLVALELHRSLHPTALARLARLASGRRGEAHTPLVMFGTPPSFVSPPSGVGRTSFLEAVTALFGDPRLVLGNESLLDQESDHAQPDHPTRLPHTTDRLRPLERAADRRPSPAAGPLELPEHD